MERWLQILLGTVFSSVGLFVFYLIFEKLVKSWIGSRGREVADGVDRIQLRVKYGHGGGGGTGMGDAEEEEMENLVYEEFDTEDHEVLAIVMENETVTVGVSLFLSDRIVEYYWTRFPDCCVHHTPPSDVSLRSFVTCLATWAEKWTLAECVNILSQDVNIVKNIGRQDTELWRKANQFETKHDFKLYTQWTENYFCDEVSSDELWYELINLAKLLLKTSGAGDEVEAENIWANFPVQHWKRKRVFPGSEHFHASVPHPGEVTPPTSNIVPVTDSLVTL